VRHDLPNLTIHQLLYVRELATAPTLTEAASRLGVTQSALSQGISEVERRLGVRLLDRKSRVATPQLTEAAAVATEVLALVDDLDRRLQELETGERGTLRLGMIDTAALGPLAEPLRAFQSDHPKLRTTLTVAPSVALTEMVRSGELDLAAVVVPNAATVGATQQFSVNGFVDEAIHIYAPPGLSRPTLKAAKAWVCYPKGSQSRMLIEQALHKRGVEMNVVAESSNPDILRQMVRIGVGWCALPRDVAESGLSPLQPIKGGSLTTRNIAFVQRKSALVNGAADAFIETAFRHHRRQHP
jgi:DNA-binding transcriptional LysR family regulator